jgi:hypothetical protein
MTAGDPNQKSRYLGDASVSSSQGSAYERSSRVQSFPIDSRLSLNRQEVCSNASNIALGSREMVHVRWSDLRDTNSDS